ncbi:hypothetical protein LI038_12135 [Clostridium perfringens]|uniref:hypothetical protein n=1 Tax=Clostridium perfringens TaxID=1502 RepID=UPI0022471C3A|nr:hypothetical protein [Clostridium perfringens]ELC8434702.1 hypothetical protein [Clostridium perfringens]MCX0395157.1 hypothetical protein [Clostridium perfringens]
MVSGICVCHDRGQSKSYKCRIKDLLFIMGNDGSLPETLKTNIIEALKDIEVEGEPDFIIIPN